MPEVVREKQHQRNKKKQQHRKAGGDGLEDSAHENRPVRIESVVKQGPEEGTCAESEAHAEGKKVGESELHWIGHEAPGKGSDQADQAQGREKDGEDSQFVRAKLFSFGQGRGCVAHGFTGVAEATSLGKRFAGAF